MNKKVVLSTIIVCLVLAGCAKEVMPQQLGQSSFTPTITAVAVSSAQLKSVLAQYTPNQIVFFQSINISDNQNGAFAITSGGDVWYILAFGAQKLKSDIAFSSDNQSDAHSLWTVDDVKIFKYESNLGQQFNILSLVCKRLETS